MAAGPTYEPIMTSTLSSSATSITLSSIPQTYTDLRIVFSFIMTSSSGFETDLTFNGDTATNYSFRYATVQKPNAPLTQNVFAQNYIHVGSGNGANPMVATIDINSYTAAVGKTTITECASDSGTSFSTYSYSTGTWFSTAAITSITLTALNLAFDVDSTVTLYGIKAA